MPEQKLIQINPKLPLALMWRTELNIYIYIYVSKTVLLNKIRLERTHYLREWLVALRFTKVNAISFTTRNLAKKIIRFSHQDIFSIPACGLAFLILSFYVNTVLYQLLHYFAPGRNCLPELHFFFPFSKYWLILVLRFPWQCSQSKALLSRKDKADTVSQE